MSKLDRLLDLDSDPIRNRPQPRTVHPGVQGALNFLKSTPGRLLVPLTAGALVTAALALTTPDNPAPPPPPSITTPNPTAP